MKSLKFKIFNLISKKGTLSGILSFSFMIIIGGYINKHTVTTIKTEKEKEIKIIEKPVIRSASVDLIPHLKKVEGFRDHPYNLSDGAITIGYGHAVFKNEKEGYDFLPNYNGLKKNKVKISNQQAEILLFDDLKDAEKSLNQLLDNLNNQGSKLEVTQGMYNAMISMIFNMGAKGFEESNFFECLQNDNLVLARNEILETSRQLFIVYPGLKSRRESEYEMFK